VVVDWNSSGFELRRSGYLRAKALVHSKAFIAVLKRCSTQNQSLLAESSRRKVLLVRLITRQGRSHADHLHEPYDRPEDHSCKVEPVGMKPVIRKSAKSVAEENCCGDDETDL
jgi:hypothetical protein